MANPLKTTVLKTSNPAGELISYLFYLRNCMHISHLGITGVGSYAAHKALNEAYDEIVDKADSLCESIQGKIGLVDIVVPASSFESPLECTNEGIAKIESFYSSFSDTFILNQLDEILTLLYKTKYKLTYLK